MEAEVMTLPKKMGRPKTDRDDASIRFDRTLAGKALMVAKARRKTQAEYLSELARAQIERDYAKLLRENPAPEV